MEKLSKRLEELKGPENKKIRKRIFYEITGLKKALENPDKFLVDPKQFLEKVA
jgi:hypothetical protein